MTPPDEDKTFRDKAYELIPSSLSQDIRMDIVDAVEKALRRQAVETLERPEVKNLEAALNGAIRHIDFCQRFDIAPTASRGKDNAWQCALDKFTKLKSDLETKGENQK